MLTQARVRELFDYDPFTGILRNKISHGRAKAGDEAGCLTYYGYRQVAFNGNSYLVHRIIWLWVYGELPDQVGHINGDKSDHRLHMLRNVSKQEIAKNTKIPSDNTSGHIGVFRGKGRKKWVARIHVNGKQKYLGYFTNKADAISARANAEIKYGFHPNHGRAA